MNEKINEQFKKLAKKRNLFNDLCDVTIKYCETEEEKIEILYKYTNKLKNEIQDFEYYFCENKTNKDIEFNNLVEDQFRHFHKSIDIYKIEESYAENNSEKESAIHIFNDSLGLFIDNIDYIYNQKNK